MKQFLSFGGGVNSIALYIWMIEQGLSPIAVFAHHGGDHPKTYEYMNYFNSECRKRGWPEVIVIKAEVKEKGEEIGLNLIEYCEKKSILPSMMFRWCTDKFKIVPVHKYCNTLMEPDEIAVMNIGIASDESHRANPPKSPPPYMQQNL